MFKLGNILFALLFINFTAFAQNTKTLKFEYRTRRLPFGLVESLPKAKPVVALALSGGGSRGLAQIGTLKAFSENNIPVEVIVGTSMGSIVGGLYSAGYSPITLDSIVSNTDWGFLLALDRETNRRDLFVDQKISEDRAVFALRLNGLNPVFPTAINNGLKLSNYLNILTLQAPIHIKNNFDELITRYRAVGTNLVNGTPEVLQRGSLSRAMRASSSVSFLLSPVRIDSSIIVDGGLVANIPVKIAKNLCDDYVIAVNATSSLGDEKSLVLPWNVADQLVSIPMKLLNENQLSSADYVIPLPLPDRLSNDFVNLDKTIDDGYYYSLPHVKKIQSILDSIFSARCSNEEFYIKNVSFRGDAKDYEVPFQIKYSKLDSVSSKEIMRDMASVFENGDLKSISAEIIYNNKFTQVRFIEEPNPLIKRINLYGITLLDKKSIQGLFSALENKPYNSKEILKSLLHTLNIYRANGYCFADVDTVMFSDFTNTTYSAL